MPQEPVNIFDFEAIARELWRVTKPGGVVVWVVGDATLKGSETGTSFRQARARICRQPISPI